MWSRRSTETACARWAALGVALLATACSSGPERARESPHPVQPSAGATGSAAASVAPEVNPAPPPQAVADFDRAVSAMRAGSTSAAQRQFEQLAASYPQFPGPEINLGILYRKSGELEQSERALRQAVQHSGSNAVAWNELGVTLRLRGQFRAAAQAYQQAISADASFAPAYRNLGVLLDLYLGDAPGALAAFERYKTLSGEQKPVSGWIAELRRRVGKGPAPSAGSVPSSAPNRTPPGSASPPATQSRAPADDSAASSTHAGV